MKMSDDPIETSDEETDEKRDEAAEETADETSKEKTIGGMSRRNFCLGVGGAVVLLGLGGIELGVGAPSLCRPPGGQDEKRFLNYCIRCQRCITACPRRVLVPAHIEAGAFNMATPTFNFNDNYCDWCEEDNNGKPLCVEVCPTGALKIPEGETRDTVCIGLPIIKTDECLGWRLTDCQFCYVACEFDAIWMDSFNRPHVDYDKCTGCGRCESVCASLKQGSIQADTTEPAILVKPIEEVEQI